jgi:hypothetical protein
MTQPSEGHKSGTKVFASLQCDLLALWATLSNCGEPLKPSPLSHSLKDGGGRVNSPGYSNSVKDATMGNPQPSPKGFTK